MWYAFLSRFSISAQALKTDLSTLSTACAAFIGLALYCLPVNAEWYQRTATAMGTEISVELWAEGPDTAARAMDAVVEEMHRVEQKFSPYLPDSELSRVNREAAQSAVPVSLEFIGLLQQAQKVSKLSHGAFDVSYAAAGKLYDFRAGIKPGDHQLSEQLPNINYQHITIAAAEQRVSFSQAGVSIDFGGIAKGHAVDRCIALLEKKGIKNAMVSAGGDSRLLGDKRGRPWVTGIKNPRGEDALLLIPLQDVAISTSGDYERYFIDEFDQQRHHHILVPSTGRSADRARSVSIIGPDATTTDALSTAVFVMGPEAGLHLINSLSGIDAIIIDDDGLLHYSADLQQATDN